MTSANSGDTAEALKSVNGRGFISLTVIPHGNIRDNLLEHGLPLHILLVFSLSIQKLFAEFLY